MASRRFRAKSSLNSNLSQVNARVSQITKRPSPRRIAANSITNVSIRNASIASENLSDGSVTSQKLAADAVRTGNIADRSVTIAKLADGTIPTVANLDASVITTGSFGEARIPNLPASKITSGTFSASVIGNLPASKITSETFDVARIPNLDTSKITSGVFDSARIPAVTIPDLDAAKITTGTFADARIPNLAASKITSGTFGTARIPSITGSMIDSLTIAGGNIAANAITISKIADGAQFNIVNDKLLAGNGLSKTGATLVTLFLDYGSASTQPATGNHRHTVTVNGNAQTVTTSVPSTLRVKKDIEPYQPVTIKNLLNLQPKTYKYKRSERMVHQALNKEVMHGYIVEELINLGFTEPVGYDEDGSPATLDYGLMSMLVLELVKVQQTEIDYLKEEITKLKDNS